MSQIILETKRLVLQKSSMSDLRNAIKLQSDPDVMRYIGQGGVRSATEVEEWLIKANQHQEKYGFSMGSVFEKESGQFVGRAGLIYLGYDDTQPEIEVGYVLHTAFWRKGYATELAKALIQWGFEHLTVNKLVAVIKPQNDASRHVLEKVGMYYKELTNC